MPTPEKAPSAAKATAQLPDAARVVKTFNAIFRDIAREVAKRQNFSWRYAPTDRIRCG